MTIVNNSALDPRGNIGFPDEALTHAGSRQESQIPDPFRYADQSFQTDGTILMVSVERLKSARL